MILNGTTTQNQLLSFWGVSENFKILFAAKYLKVPLLHDRLLHVLPPNLLYYYRTKDFNKKNINLCR